MTDLQLKLIQDHEILGDVSKKEEKDWYKKNYIQKELENFIEVEELVLERDVLFRYISIKNGRLKLHKGGHIYDIGENIVKFRFKGSFWYVKRRFYNEQNELIFTTKFFKKIENPTKELKKKLDNMEQVLKIVIDTVKKQNKQIKSLNSMIGVLNDDT